ncbi:LytR/AlgR family response regulator transcription factor [Methylomonas koyamae]|uniref:LytR/AlgR family response regulator transcription factor n=1 Tax=Methylomonas koyamae TaxID=702114 RepID=UPI0006CFF500|nr:LytTR family DNA-binding domain-containing protein [Methylomonas koyamae]ATG88423.1 DNA-binding response regulator [Methylomonas koyamae]BBL56492.1 sensory transduction protein LytT [Methylomonas koyamae]
MVATQRVLLVDDEYLARDELKDILRRRHPDFEPVAEAANAREAWAALQREQIGGVFLDIHIQTEGERAGLDLAYAINNLPAAPWIVFITGHPQTAVEAHRLHPAHYLLKPLDDAKVDEALSWIRRQAARAVFGADPLPQRIKIRHRIVNRFDERETHVEYVDPREIVFIAKNNAANSLRIQLSNGTALDGVYGALKEWEHKYPGLGLLQIHRSHLVNIRQVRSLRPRPGENEVYKVALKDSAHELAVGPEYLETLRQKMEVGLR